MKRLSLTLNLALVLTVLSVAAFAQQPVNNAQTAGTTTATGNGVTGSGSQRVTIASDNTAFAVNSTLSAETTKVIGTVNIASGQSVGLSTGSNVIGHVIVDTTSTTAVTQATGTNLHAVLDTTSTTAVTQATAANLNATVVQATGSNLHVVCDSGCTAGTTISLIPATTGGLSHTHFVAAASDNATSLKGSAGQLYTVDVYNAAAYPVYLKLYNKATSPTSCGATNLFKVVGVQAGTQKTLSSEQGYAMGTGIGYCLTKGITDADDTSVLISDATVDLGYK